MPKSIWFPDGDFEKLVELARECGFRVSRGRGSQLRQFVMMAANTACSRPGEGSAKIGVSKPRSNPVSKRGPKPAPGG